jgi:hypothetical protein
MTDKVHPLVELLVARAKSHPDEFKDDMDSIAASDRWWRAINVISQNGTDADKALLASTIGRIAMDRAHEWALDELLNGDERREAIRREKEEAADNVDEAADVDCAAVRDVVGGAGGAAERH